MLFVCINLSFTDVAKNPVHYKKNDARQSSQTDILSQTSSILSAGCNIPAPGPSACTLVMKIPWNGNRNIKY